MFTGPAQGGRNGRRAGGGARSVRAALCSPGTLPAYPHHSHYHSMLSRYHSRAAIVNAPQGRAGD